MLVTAHDVSLVASHLTSTVDHNKYQIQMPLPPKIDTSVTMMQVEEKPDVTYSDIGGCREQIEKLREVVETQSRRCRRLCNTRSPRPSLPIVQVAWRLSSLQSHPFLLARFQHRLGNLVLSTMSRGHLGGRHRHHHPLVLPLQAQTPSNAAATLRDAGKRCTHLVKLGSPLVGHHPHYSLCIGNFHLPPCPLSSDAT